ncbi:MAG: ArsA family ATPase [Deltaproteobacteria bacterium]|nr:ArsA family ATPase [Deltaproteobacteria bacterium]
MRLVLYTGKGGVGKTTTAAATAACAAARGRRTLIVSADAAHSLGDVLGRRLGPQPAPVAPSLDALEADARCEMERQWGRVRDYLLALFRHQGIDDVVAEELALLPGAEELATLLAVEEHGREGSYDLVVVDCAPTDAALRLLTLPDVARSALRLALKLQQAVASVAGPIARAFVSTPLPDAGVFGDIERLLYEKLRRLRARIASEKTSVRLVVTPERMVIDEARRAFTDLALFDIACDAVVMNRLLPAAARKETFFRDWARVEQERRREVESVFAPLPVIAAPLRDDEVIGLDALRAHGEALFERCEPDAVLGARARIRFAAEAAGWRVELPLPHVSYDGLEVAKIGAELVVRTGSRRRSLSLPRRLAALSLASARVEHETLVVRLASAASNARADQSLPCA